MPDFPTCSKCGKMFLPPRQPGVGCEDQHCPFDQLAVEGQKLLQVLLDVTARWSNNENVDARVIAFAYGGAAGACLQMLPPEHKLQYVHRMC